MIVEGEIKGTYKRVKRCVRYLDWTCRLDLSDGTTVIRTDDRQMEISTVYF